MNSDPADPIWLEAPGAVKRFAVPYAEGIPCDDQRAILRAAHAATVVIRTLPDGRKFALYRCVMDPAGVCAANAPDADAFRNAHPDHLVIVDV